MIWRILSTTHGDEVICFTIVHSVLFLFLSLSRPDFMNVTDVDSSGLSHLGRRDEQRTNSWLALFLRFGEGTVGYYLVVSTSTWYTTYRYAGKIFTFLVVVGANPAGREACRFSDEDDNARERASGRRQGEGSIQSRAEVNDL